MTQDDITCVSVCLRREDALRFRALAYARGMTRGEYVRWMIDQEFDRPMTERERERLQAALEGRPNV